MKKQHENGYLCFSLVNLVVSAIKMLGTTSQILFDTNTEKVGTKKSICNTLHMKPQS
jgi:hypothetical protein